MLKDTWQELGRLENLFLEIIEDPLKKEILLYPICYCQLVRRYNSFEIDLPRLVSCANKTFHTYKGKWQDILLELDLFMFISPSGDVLFGKDMLSVQTPEGFTVTFLPEYREAFFDVYSKLLKYWAVLSKISTYTKKNTPAEMVYLVSTIFNEELFKECSSYAQNLCMRFPKEITFFSAIRDLAEFYYRYRNSRELRMDLLEGSYERIISLTDPYYGIDTVKLGKDMYSLIKALDKGKRPFVIKISFSSGTSAKSLSLRGILRRIWNKIKSVGGGRWTLTSSEIAYYCSIGTSLRRQKDPQILP